MRTWIRILNNDDNDHSSNNSQQDNDDNGVLLTPHFGLRTMTSVATSLDSEIKTGLLFAMAGNTDLVEKACKILVANQVKSSNKSALLGKTDLRKLFPDRQFSFKKDASFESSHLHNLRSSFDTYHKHLCN